MFWRSVIDNIASHRTPTLKFDIERHTTFCMNKRGEKRFAVPRYSFMIVAPRVREPGWKGAILRKQLSLGRFKAAMEQLPHYSLHRESPARVVFLSRKNNLLANCIFGAYEEKAGGAGPMVGIIQPEPVGKLAEVAEKILPKAVGDFNFLSEELNVGEKITKALLEKMRKEAETADKNTAKGRKETPRNPWRYYFEQY